VEAPQEFQSLFAREYSAVVWNANLVVHDYGRAEEIAQDAFVQLLAHWSKVRRYDAPGAWVRRVTIRLAVRAAKREARRSTIERMWRPPPPESGQPLDPNLMTAIRELSPMQRAVVVLYYLDNATVQQAADVLGCASSTVSVHLHRARGHLAELLAEEVGPHVE